MSTLFPWDKVEKGQGFFIPALDPEEVREAGLRLAAVKRVFDARAEFVIRRGQVGVWFYRVQSARK